jgi:hypothetical protein
MNWWQIALMTIFALYVCGTLTEIANKLTVIASLLSQINARNSDS